MLLSPPPMLRIHVKYERMELAARLRVHVCGSLDVQIRHPYDM